MRAALLALICCLPASVFAQESDAIPVEIYGLGDQTFSINAGVLMPLFFFPGESSALDPALPHQYIGASGALRWATFLGNSLSVGAELGGMYSSTVLDHTLISIPVTGHLDYAIRFFPFEVSLHGNLGVNFLRLENDLYIGPILKPGASFYWNYNNEWAFGLRLEYWFIPEIYFSGTPPASHTRFGNYLTVNLVTLYHF